MCGLNDVTVLDGMAGLCSAIGAEVSDGGLLAFPNASQALKHFMDNSGNMMCFDNFYSAVALTRQQRFNYYIILNEFMQMIEETVVPNQVYYFTTSREPEYRVSYQSDYQIEFLSVSESDWFLAVGGGQNAIQAEVICEESAEKGKTYKVKLKFYVIDYYDWDKENPVLKHLYNLHLYGMARNFLSYGVYETVVEWNEGGRFPDIVKDSESMEDAMKKIDLTQTEFENVRDDNLKQSCINASSLYIKNELSSAFNDILTVLIRKHCGYK